MPFSAKNPQYADPVARICTHGGSDSLSFGECSTSHQPCSLHRGGHCHTRTPRGAARRVLCQSMGREGFTYVQVPTVPVVGWSLVAPVWSRLRLCTGLSDSKKKRFTKDHGALAPLDALDTTTATYLYGF